MKSEDIYNAITNLPNDLIEPKRKKRSYVHFISAIAAVLVVALAAVGFNNYFAPNIGSNKPTTPDFSGSAPQAPSSPSAPGDHYSGGTNPSERPGDSAPSGPNDWNVTNPSDPGAPSAPETPGTAVPPDDPTGADFALKKAVYPTRLSLPDFSDYSMDSEGLRAYNTAYQAWQDEQKTRLLPANVDIAGMYSFISKANAQMLGKNSTDNLLYSPINVYLALCMLAETTAGNSQKQVLELLGEDSIESLRATASALWNAVYCDDGKVQTYLGSSLWLSDSLSYNENTVQKLADTYYASSFRGKMGSEAFNKALQSWLNENTGGLLKEQVSGEKFSSNTVFALATTLYFSGQWTDKFAEKNTAQDIFHSPGGDVTVDFMQSSSVGKYYYAEGYSAVAKDIADGEAKMWLILPDEGVSAQSLVTSDKLGSLIYRGGEGVSNVEISVNLKLPKFDVDSKTDLKEELQALGLTDVFNDATSDFSPMTEGDGLFLSRVSHGVRVKVDEEGCEGAAYTLMPVDSKGDPFSEKEVDFVLDRPFVFAITNSQNIPLFIGIVNQP